MKKTYINNSYFMEFVDEIATQITEMNFGEDTYSSKNHTPFHNKYRDGYKFNNDPQDYYNEMYGEYEKMMNNMMGVYSENNNIPLWNEKLSKLK